MNENKIKSLIKFHGERQRLFFIFIPLYAERNRKFSY